MSDQSPYTINVEDAGPARKRVSVTISSSAVDAQLQQQLAAVSASVQLPGFRKGKVPRAVVEKRFGEAIFDALCQLLEPVSSSSPLAISFEIQEIDAVLTWKKNNLREYMAKRRN